MIVPPHPSPQWLNQRYGGVLTSSSSLAKHSFPKDLYVVVSISIFSEDGSGMEISVDIADSLNSHWIADGMSWWAGHSVCIIADSDRDVLHGNFNRMWIAMVRSLYLWCCMLFRNMSRNNVNGDHALFRAGNRGRAIIRWWDLFRHWDTGFAGIVYKRWSGASAPAV